METLRRSPPIIGTCGISTSIVTASSRSTSGRTARFSTASTIASLLARRMLIASIIRGSITPTATARARRRINRQMSTRSSRSTSLESFTPKRSGSESRMTQAATTGPARQPRPTSSVPAMARKPKSRSRRSIADISATRANSAKRFRTSRSPGFGLAFALFFDARCFTAEIPEVVELRATDPAMAFDLDAINAGRIEWEHALHADSTRDLTDGEHLPRAAAFARDHQTLEDLDTFLVAFFDLHMNLDRISRRKCRNVGARFTRFDELHEILSHDDNLPVFLSEPASIADFGGLGNLVDANSSPGGSARRRTSPPADSFLTNSLQHFPRFLVEVCVGDQIGPLS